MLKIQGLIASLFLLSSVIQSAEADPNALNKSGNELLFSGKFAEAVAQFDAEIKAQPERAPHHWQRGIALYYAGKADEGRKQFESHKSVNPNDVENAAWHFLCATKASGLENAKKNLIAIDLTQDTRVPMKQIFALFKGEGTAEDVIAAAKAGDPAPETLKNNLCYAHLYLGLYYDALGNQKLEREHITKAAVDYKQDHYMGMCAQVHLKYKRISVPVEKLRD